MKSLMLMLEERRDLDTLRAAQAVQMKADEAWDKAADAGARGDDLTAEYWRGKAHAFCEVLGDQTNLFRLADQIHDAAGNE